MSQATKAQVTFNLAKAMDRALRLASDAHAAWFDATASGDRVAAKAWALALAKRNSEAQALKVAYDKAMVA